VTPAALRIALVCGRVGVPVRLASVLAGMCQVNARMIRLEKRRRKGAHMEKICGSGVSSAKLVRDV
jgi:hypothetical protein